MASTVWVLVVSKVRKTASGFLAPDSVITCEAVNGWLNTRSKYTVYGVLSPQNPPLVSEPEISVSLTTVALVAVSGFWLSISLTRKSAEVVAGKVNSPIELCGVAVN